LRRSKAMVDETRQGRLDRVTAANEAVDIISPEPLVVMRRDSLVKLLGEPVQVLLVGDTHGIEADARAAIEAAELREVDYIVQLGDFAYGFDPKFMELWEFAPCPVYFLRGNHDDVGVLKHLAGSLVGPDPVEVWENVHYLPDGCTVHLGGSKVAVLGGAVSIDRANRVEDVSWWREECTRADAVIELITNHHQADVLLTHDAPEGIPAVQRRIGGFPAYPETQVNRRLLREAFDHLRPAMLAHGHYHFAYDAHWHGALTYGLSFRGADALKEVTF
jgi:predicted phosphodiesterase